MKAFVLDRYAKQGALRPADIPPPDLHDDEVLVAVHAAGVNLLDAKIRSGEFKLILPYKLPLVLGHDVAGVVVKVGSRVQQFKPGDEVYARPDDFRIGAFAELLAVKESSLAAKPRGLTMEEAASIPLVGLTAWQALVEKAQLQKGQKVFIQAGSGGVGTFAIQLAKHLGATVATTTSAGNAALVKSLGADVVIDYKTQNFEDVLRDYDVVLHSQDGQALAKSLRVLKKGGRLISISGPPDPEFGKDIRAPGFVRLVMRLLSAGTRRRARKLGIGYSFLFMRAHGGQLQEITRLIEAGAIRLGVVNARTGGYASNAAVTRRAAQCERNAAALARTMYRNEAGQVFTLADLAAGSVSNPAIRGGELMTRIRGAEEYADAAGHVGLFVTLTCPSAMHAVKRGSGGRVQPNERYDGHSTPRTSQLWLRTQWARARAALHRQGVRMYGLRVAEPHHDATPHWHSLLWFETAAAAALAEGIIRAQWLSEYGDEKGAAVNRVNVKRLTAGGAAGYVAKYVAKSVGHHAIGDSLDTVQGELLTVQAGDVPGHRRVDAWAATWGIRQFQFLGLPPVTVWRELRRVTSDQAQAARIAGDATVWKCWAASGARYLSGLNGLACWRTFMHGMGGHCQGRGRWALRTVRRAEPGKVNDYGEAIAGPVVGVETARDPGRWLISRRMAWARVATGAAVDQSKASEPRSGSPWTGFNNCTARLTGKLRAALIGLKHAGQCAAELKARGRYVDSSAYLAT